MNASNDDAEAHAGFSPLFEHAATDTLETKSKWVGGWAAQAALASRVPNVNNTQESKSKRPLRIEPCEKLINLFSEDAHPNDVKDYLKVVPTVCFFSTNKVKYDFFIRIFSY